MTIAEQLKEIGRKEGREEGREEGRLEIAYTLLHSGLDRHFVIEQLQLTKDDVAKLNL